MAHGGGRSDPLGDVAFLLNYVPILGTALGVLIFLLAGLLTIDTLWQALLPAGLYVALHLVEGQTLTPMLLARRFTSILSSSSRSCSGSGCGGFPEPFCLCQCWRLPRLFATVFGHWLHSVIFLRDKTRSKKHKRIEFPLRVPRVSPVPYYQLR